MGGSFDVGHISGIKIRINYSWLLAFALITWSLAVGFFPQDYPGFAAGTYWILGASAAILLFVSVLIHELAHSFVARSRGMPVESITLFIFGGVSNISREARRARDEFTMALVGPLTSLVLSGLFWGSLILMGEDSSPLAALAAYLALINALLAAFNLLPALPLDGGRVFRSVVWGITGSLSRATDISASVGQLFAWAFIGFGLFEVLSGNVLTGIWIAFIGWFLHGAADASRQGVTVEEHLRGVRVRDVMTTDSAFVSPDTSVQDLVQDVFLKSNVRSAPVCRGGIAVGIVTLKDVTHIPQKDWPWTRLEHVMQSEPLYTVKENDDLASALQVLSEKDINQAIVTQDGQCVGLLRRADVIRHLQISRELGLASKSSA